MLNLKNFELRLKSGKDRIVIIRKQYLINNFIIEIIRRIGIIILRTLQI